MLISAMCTICHLDFTPKDYNQMDAQEYLFIAVVMDPISNH